MYYFSGTGNSLHIAKELQKRIPNTTLIPMISLLKKETVKTNADIVAIVFPLHLTTLPKPVDEFVKKLDMTSAKYAFSIITRIGTFSTANVYLNKVLRKRGKLLDASFMINMANNSPAGLKPFADKKWVEKISNANVLGLEKKVQESLQFVVDCVVRREKIHANGTMSFSSHILEPIMTKLTHKTSHEIPFYTDASCTGCGICGRVCLSGKIKAVNGKVMWDESVQCFYCYACFNFCPEQSILIDKKYDLKNGRYHHPDIDYKEICAQKDKMD